MKENVQRSTSNAQRPIAESVYPKPATWRIVVDESFSFAIGGVPPSLFKRLIIRALLGWRVEFTKAGEQITAEKQNG